VRDTEFERIRSLPLFRDLDRRHLESLMEGAYLQKFPARAVLVQQEGPVGFCHVLLDGLIELFADFDGREVGTYVVRPVRTFLLGAALQDKPALASARTLMPSQVLMIAARNMHDVRAKDAAFAGTIIDELCSGMRIAVKELHDQKLRTGTERLANWILRSDSASGGSGSFDIPYDRETLALRLGMTRVNLARGLARLRLQGVQIRGRQVRILDRAALSDLAKPIPAIDDCDY
jgi:CRP/FNR family transcriptional activator FtrB